MTQKILLLLIIACCYSTYAQYTDIPDPNFESALGEEGLDDIADDGKIPTSNINAITTLRLINKNISDLTGIEAFEALETLTFNNNPQLTTLDLTNNTNLKSLVLVFNNISSIDLSGNPNLEFLQLSRNNIENIDLSNNTKLKRLELSRNNIESLDLSNNTKLERLELDGNELNTINLSNNTQLDRLNLRENNLSTINLSANTLLEQIDVRENNLSSLDLSANTALTRLDVRENILNSLNLKNGNNDDIREMNATSNPDLLCVTVDNEIDAMDDEGTYERWRIDNKFYFAEDCSADITVKYILVPDTELEEELENFDTKRRLKDGLIPRANIINVTELDLRTGSIVDITGLQEFTSLEKLDCSNNDITEITVDKLPTSLKELKINQNKIENLELRDLNLLEILDCSSNDMNSITLENLDNLKDLNCSSNNLTNLEISNLSALEILDCANNELVSLDTSNNSNLTRILGSINRYTSLDFSNNSELETIFISITPLETINLKNGSFAHPSLVTLSGNTQLTCIQVDNQIDATNGVGKYEFWNKDDAAQYSEECNLLSTPDFDNGLDFSVYPIPANGVLNITGDLGYKKVKIYDTLGSLVFSKDSEENVLDISQLTKGIYFINITVNNKKGIKKIVVQ